MTVTIMQVLKVIYEVTPESDVITLTALTLLQYVWVNGSVCFNCQITWFGSLGWTDGLCISCLFYLLNSAVKLVCGDDEQSVNKSIDQQ